MAELQTPARKKPYYDDDCGIAEPCFGKSAGAGRQGRHRGIPVQSAGSEPAEGAAAAGAAFAGDGTDRSSLVRLPPQAICGYDKLFTIAHKLPGQTCYSFARENGTPPRSTAES